MNKAIYQQNFDMWLRGKTGHPPIRSAVRSPADTELQIGLYMCMNG